MDRALDGAIGRLPEGVDLRDRSTALVAALWSLSGREGPAVVLFFAPPYYPDVAPEAGPLAGAARRVAEAAAVPNLVVRDYFPLLSDLSYFRLDGRVDLVPLTENMPIWSNEGGPGTYRLPLDLMREFELPVVNIGPYGRGAHQPGERVYAPYSFGVVPRLIWETLERMAEPESGR